MKKSKKIILSLIILLIALSFRLIGLDWDQGQHLHPDERFLTMVETAIKIPKTLSEYLNPKISPMSPYNNNFSFFVYGTFPLNLTKILGEITNHKTYANIHLLGRVLSAIFDVGVVVLLFKIGKRVFDEKVGFIASFLYSIMVLPIQLSHFFTVDTFLNFFLTLSFYFLLGLFLLDKKLKKGGRINKKSLFNAFFLGSSFGFALACKISALYFLPIIILGLIFSFLRYKKISQFICQILLFSAATYFFFRINQPQAFIDNNFLNPIFNPQFVANLKELQLSSVNDPNTFFPPAIQWIGTKPIVFPYANLVLWGIGLPLGIIASISFVFLLLESLASFIKNVKKLLKRELTSLPAVELLVLIWITLLFIYQGIQFGKPLRYFLPICPFLALTSSLFLSKIINHFNNIRLKNIYFFGGLFLITLLIYPLSFLSIYTHPHSRVAASRWIYNNIPKNSVITYEHWDDGLPLGLDGKNNSIYQYEGLSLFAPDTEEKRNTLNKQLERIDYLIFSSNRFWGPIPRLPGKYPITSNFYRDLFSGKLNFKEIAEITSYPCFPPIGKPLFCFPDQSAEESFTVYDHPKVLIFKKEI